MAAPITGAPKFWSCVSASNSPLRLNQHMLPVPSHPHAQVHCTSHTRIAFLAVVLWWSSKSLQEWCSPSLCNNRATFTLTYGNTQAATGRCLRERFGLVCHGSDDVASGCNTRGPEQAGVMQIGQEGRPETASLRRWFPSAHTSTQQPL